MYGKNCIMSYCEWINSILVLSNWKTEKEWEYNMNIIRIISVIYFLNQTYFRCREECPDFEFQQFLDEWLQVHRTDFILQLLPVKTSSTCLSMIMSEYITSRRYIKIFKKIVSELRTEARRPLRWREPTQCWVFVASSPWWRITPHWWSWGRKF